MRWRRRTGTLTLLPGSPLELGMRMILHDGTHVEVVGISSRDCVVYRVIPWWLRLWRWMGDLFG